MIKFRTYIRNSALYYLVHVWDTKEELLTYRASSGVAKEDLNCEAYVDVYDIVKVLPNYKGTRKLPILGEVHFHRNRLGTETISHETVHAVTAYMRRMNKSLSALDEENGNDSGFEEEFAYAIGRFNRDVVDRLYKLGLYKPKEV